MLQSKFLAVKLHFFKFHICTTENGEVHVWKIQMHLQMTDTMNKALVKKQVCFPLRQAYGKGFSN